MEKNYFTGVIWLTIFLHCSHKISYQRELSSNKARQWSTTIFDTKEEQDGRSSLRTHPHTQPFSPAPAQTDPPPNAQLCQHISKRSFMRTGEPNTTQSLSHSLTHHLTARHTPTPHPTTQPPILGLTHRITTMRGYTGEPLTSRVSLERRASAWLRIVSRGQPVGAASLGRARKSDQQFFHVSCLSV